MRQKKILMKKKTPFNDRPATKLFLTPPKRTTPPALAPPVGVGFFFFF